MPSQKISKSSVLSFENQRRGAIQFQCSIELKNPRGVILLILLVLLVELDDAGFKANTQSFFSEEANPDILSFCRAKTCPFK